MTAPNSNFVQALERRCLLAHCAGIDGIGVLGDSYSDEYQFYPPDRITARNWVEQLDEDSNANFGPFSLVDPPGSLNAGFGFNWAASGATSGTMIGSGQHAGVAAQAASGQVDLVTMFIGGNDFRAVFDILLTQGLPPAIAALQAVVPAVTTNIAIATNTILAPATVAANPDLSLILTTLPNLSYLPQVRAAVDAFPQIEPFVALVDQASHALNQQIRGIAAGNPRIAVADFDGLIDGIFAADEFRFAGIPINVDAIHNPTNDPTYLVLADLIHPGTIAQGLLANLYVTTANENFGARLHRLTPIEILENAGLDVRPAHRTMSAPFASGPFIAAAEDADLFDTADDEAPAPVAS